MSEGIFRFQKHKVFLFDLPFGRKQYAAAVLFSCLVAREDRESKEKIKSKVNNDENDETVKKIIDVLDTKIRPAVARDGGDIKFKSFENGVVKVELQGSCSGCPSSLMTLKQGVQNLLKHYVKEVNSVEAN